MEITGLHILVSLLGAVSMIYLVFAIVIGVLVEDGEARSAGFGGFRVFVRKWKKAHIVLGIAAVLLVMFKPIKLVSQSDVSRTAVRHSFDTEIYRSESPFQPGAQQQYSLDDIREEQRQSQEKWDKIRNNQR